MEKASIKNKLTMAMGTKAGQLVGKSLYKRVKKFAGNLTANTNSNSNKNNKKVFLPAFINGLTNTGLSRQEITKYSQLITKLTGTNNAQGDLVQLLMALTQLIQPTINVSSNRYGRSIGAPTKRVIEKIVFPALKGLKGRQGPPQNLPPSITGFINELKNLNLSKPIGNFAPGNAGNIKIIVNKARSLSNSNKSNNNKRQNSEQLGAAMSRILNKALGKVNMTGRPRAANIKGPIMNGFIKGFLSQNKTGTATFASKFLGNQLGIKNLSPEIRNIILTIVKNPNNTTNQKKVFIRQVINLYHKLPNSKKFTTMGKALTAAKGAGIEVAKSIVPGVEAIASGIGAARRYYYPNKPPPNKPRQAWNNIKNNNANFPNGGTNNRRVSSGNGRLGPA
jgi:hypothetical protein